MRTDRPFRPRPDPLEGRVALSHAAHALPATALVVHLDGKGSADREIGGDLESGRPFYIRVVASDANLLGLTIASPAGSEAVARVRPKGFRGGSARIDSSMPGLGDEINLGVRHGRLVAAMIRVTGAGRFTLRASASIGADVPPP